MGQAKRKEKAKAKNQGRAREKAVEVPPEKRAQGSAVPSAQGAAAPVAISGAPEKAPEGTPAKAPEAPSPAPPAEGTPPAAPAEGTAPAATFTPWVKPEGLSARGWAVLAAVVLVSQLPLVHYALLRDEPAVTTQVPYQQDFSDRSVVERDFFSVGGYWRVASDQLLAPQVKNNPLWLQARLPDDVAVEFDVRSNYPEGDIRLELFGDGTDPSSGYVLVQGGWNNTLSVLARLDMNAPALKTLKDGEFKKDTKVRVETPSAPVQAGRTYHWRVERRGTLLRWSIDGRPVLELNDPFPLKGPGHDRLGLNGFESVIQFDNLRVLPVDASVPLPELPAPPPTPPPGPYADTFDRDSLGENWEVTNPAAVTLEKGTLTLQLTHNRPVWLKRPIPTNATIEFDAWTDDPQGDIKVEAWGDGQSFYGGDLRMQYTASGYVFILGGWRNTQSVIARQTEHTPDRAVRDGRAVEPGQRYHFTITRRGATIEWSINGQPFLSMRDPSPLEGPRNQYFGFSGWKTKVHFDNLKIQPL